MNERVIAQSMAGRYGYGVGNFVGFSSGSPYLYDVCPDAYGHPTAGAPSADRPVAAGSGSSLKLSLGVSLLVIVVTLGLLAGLAII